MGGITEYVDGGYSGSNLNRPALSSYKRILKVKNKCGDCLSMDRLSRSQRDTLYLIEEMFLPNNVEFISISETIDTSTPFGRAMIGVMSVFAQLERETITERLRSGRSKMVRDQGLWAGGSDASPYGYTRLKRGKLVVNEEERQHIVRIFEEYVTLKSYIKVQKKLEKEGFKPLEDYRITKLLKTDCISVKFHLQANGSKGHMNRLYRLIYLMPPKKSMNTSKVTIIGKIKNNVFRQKVICGCCGETYRSYSKKHKKDGSNVLLYGVSPSQNARSLRE